jgi:hypothetical protein
MQAMRGLQALWVFDLLLLDLHRVLGWFNRRSEFACVNLGELGSEN